MKERPILFSAPMVRAILAGRKTQTRRVVKPQSAVLTDDTARALGVRPPPHQNTPVIQCPYGQPGDRLWVRETWMEDHSVTTDERGRLPILYRSTCLNHPDGRWRPSIHMPRWASRIDLEVTGVRVERLQDISDADAIAEGIELLHGRYTFNGGLHESRSAVNAFFALWDSVHGQGAWDANPWVWVVEFRRVKP